MAMSEFHLQSFNFTFNKTNRKDEKQHGKVFTTLIVWINVCMYISLIDANRKYKKSWKIYETLLGKSANQGVNTCD